MKSIVSIAALVAVAGSAAAQLDLAQPVQFGEPQFMATDGVSRVVTQAHVTPNTKAGLDGNTYSVNHAVFDGLVAQFMASDPASVFVSAGQASPFPLNFTGASGGRNIFYNPADAAWTDTAVLPGNVIDDPTLLLLQMDSDVELVPGTHEIVIRAWFASDGASVFPFAQPSSTVAIDGISDPMFTPTVIGGNDAIPDGQRHPTGLGGDIGDAINGFGGTGLQPPAGMVWDAGSPPIVTDWVILGFRNLDGAFVGVTFGVFPNANIDANGDLVVEFLAVQPATLEINSDTGFEDFSLGGGPLTWGDGLTDSYLAYALQYEITATATMGGTPCPGDIGDANGFPGQDGVVDFGDFLFLLSQAGPCGTPCPGDIGDANGFPGQDGVVDFGDFLYLLSQAGPCP